MLGGRLLPQRPPSWASASSIAIAALVTALMVSTGAGVGAAQRPLVVNYSAPFHASGIENGSSTKTGCGATTSIYPVTTGRGSGFLNMEPKASVVACGAAASGVSLQFTNGLLTPQFTVNTSGAYPINCLWFLELAKVAVAFSANASNSSSYASVQLSLNCGVVDVTTGKLIPLPVTTVTEFSDNSSWGAYLFFKGGNRSSFVAELSSRTLTVGHTYKIEATAQAIVTVYLATSAPGASITVSTILRPVLAGATVV